MTRQKKSPVMSDRLAVALERLVHAGTLSTRTSRRKSADSPRMDTKARLHARRFLKLYYTEPDGADPEIGIGEGGSVTLKWVHSEINPQTGESWPLELLLTLHPDASYRLAISEFDETEIGEGLKADSVLARRLARQSVGDRFTCVECGVSTEETLEYYMVHDHIWEAATRNATDYMLCIGCLEQRIGRVLVPVDFSDVPINYPRGWPHSDRLKDRLGYDA